MEKTEVDYHAEANHVTDIYIIIRTDTETGLDRVDGIWLDSDTAIGEAESGSSYENRARVDRISLGSDATRETIATFLEDPNHIPFILPPCPSRRRLLKE